MIDPDPETPIERRAAAAPARMAASTRAKLESYFRIAAFAVLALVGAVATVRLYFAMESAILTWFRPQYIAIAQAVYSLLILAIVVWLLRVWVISRAHD